MSFFPSADPDEEQTPCVDGQHFFPAQNTTSFAHLANIDCVDYNLIYQGTSHGLPNTQAIAWPPTFDSQGLGLQFPPSTGSFVTEYSSSATFTQPATTSFTWSADFTPTQTPVADAHCFRRHSAWSDSCVPASTVQPSQLWEPFQPAAGSVYVRDPSPGPSEYSTSSYQSTASSPFVSPAGRGRVMSSPMVKSESEPLLSSSQRLLDVPALQESLGVERRDFALLATTPGTQVHPHRHPSASASDAGDVKPSLRPGSRRASTAADTEDVQFHGRRKRSLTRPDNASCSCDICGKLFQRCYNLKAHMETHDANRNMPNKCKHPGCGKRFVRRTDLVRHNESVHVRSRPFACVRCHNNFARKDTLQRHLDDGCSMRPEVKKRAVKSSRSRASPPIKKEPMPESPGPRASLSPAVMERLRRS